MASSSSSPPCITIYRNDDTTMVRPYKMTIPDSIDTLAELCQHLSKGIPLPDGAAAAKKGFRFLYSLSGKPLWRVRECVDAQTIVVSVGPGFLARHRGISGLAPHAIVDITPPPDPEVVEATPDSADSRGPTGVTSGASASPLPHPQRAGQPPTSAAEQTATSSSAAPRWSINVSGGSVERVAAPHGSGSHGGVPAVHVVEAAGRRSTSWESHSVASPSVLQRQGATDASTSAPAAPSAPQPHTYAGKKPGSDMASPSMGLNHSSFRDPSARAAQRDYTAAAASAASGSLPRKQVLLGGTLVSLPPAPSFLPVAEIIQTQLMDETTRDGHLRLLLSRKWGAFQQLRQAAPATVLAPAFLKRTADSLLRTFVSDREEGVRRHPFHVVVHGPRHSGVSTTAALVSQECVPRWAPNQPFENMLLLPLDFNAMLPAAAGGSPDPAENPRMLFQVAVRALMDAVAVQRPALRGLTLMFAELWDKLVLPTQRPPNFCKYTQVAAAVGIKVLARWDSFAQQVFPLLQAVCRDVDAGGTAFTGSGGTLTAATSLRDAFLDVLFYAIPNEVASAMQFSGVFYTIDGLDRITGADSGDRGVADVAAILKPIWASAHNAAVVAWPHTVALDSVSLPRTNARLSTIGLLPRDVVLEECRMPASIVCGERRFDVGVFAGSPGYLSVLRALVAPYRPPPLTTTNQSAFYTQMKASAQQRRYSVVLNSDAAFSALDVLERKTLQLVR